MYDEPKFTLAGDQAVSVELGNEIDPAVNKRIHSLKRIVQERSIPGLRDLIPTYNSLLVQYDPITIGLEDLQNIVVDAFGNLDEHSTDSIRIVLLPTLYGGEYGPDLEFISDQASMTKEEVVTTHSSTDYLVYMLGFTPGFPYLGGLDNRLATPRLETPRPTIPSGSVGIAENQTGVYPTVSPGGWRLIGRTPLDLFDAYREPASLISAGDYVRFVPLTDESQFSEIRSQIKLGNYEVSIEWSQ